jgi:scyllo-inositol 2-dehydrogenase (NADP+)
LTSPKIKTGLIGYGFGGSVFHAPLVLAVPELRLKSVVTSRKEAVAKDLPGVDVVGTVAELLDDPEIQLVVVASPSTTHFEVAMAALRAGKNVVVDKPFATTVREAEALLQLAEDRKLFLSVYQNRRWDGDFLTVKQCIAEGLLGTIFHYEAHFDRFRQQIKSGWREGTERGSGIVYDLGAHLIDQAVQLFGMPHAVTADILIQRSAGQADDYFHIVLHYGRMRAILHAATLVCAPGPHFAVHGDAGSFLKYGMDPQEEALKSGARPGDPGWGVDPPENYGELVAADGSQRKIPTLVGGYERYYQGVAASLLHGAPNPVDPAGARDGLAVIEAAMRSSEEKRTMDTRR